MDSRARLFGHSIHPMLIVFPLGLLAMGAVFDVVYLLDGSYIYGAVAFWMLVAGIVGGALAAPFGLIDWLAIPKRTRAKRVGAVHGLGNVVALALFLASVMIRGEAVSAPPIAAYVCSFAGVACALVTAWLGGELVSRLGVGVSDGANVDAPSSLKGRHSYIEQTGRY
jgi:uncharacterized membrane protein